MACPANATIGAVREDYPMQVKFGEGFRRLVPELAPGIVFPRSKLVRSPELWSAIDKYVHDLQSSIRNEDLSSIPEIKAMRDGYRAMGKDPSRYRPSQEALLRRVLQGKEAFKVNTVGGYQ